jgi:predicted kinase
MNYITEDLKVNWDMVETTPEFQALKGKGYHSDWHQEGDSWEHTKLVVKECQKYLKEHSDDFTDKEKYILLMTSLFHDIGKGKTNQLKEDGNWSAPYHAVEGERLARFMLWDEPLYIREMICSLIKYHMRPKFLQYKSKEEVDKTLIEFSKNSNSRLLYYINLFDVLGSISNDKENQIQQCEIFKEYAHRQIAWCEDFIGVDFSFKVVMLCGVAGGGKTTAYETFYKPLGYELVSRDIIRMELGMVSQNGKFKGNKEQEQKVTEIEHKRIKELCEQKKNFVSDNLFIRKKYRDEFIKMVSPYKPAISIEYYETFKQNHINRRNGQIHPNTILNMMREMDFPCPTEADVVTYRRNNDNETVEKYTGFL